MKNAKMDSVGSIKGYLNGKRLLIFVTGRCEYTQRNHSATLLLFFSTAYILSFLQNYIQKQLTNDRMLNVAVE